jgi:hypothetical protein
VNWTRYIDGYCERVEPGLWAEPVNAVTNLAFLVAAAIAWARPGVAGLPLARALALVLAAIGVGSGLFHTVAQAWAAMADVLPILAFILVYIYAANRHFLGLPRWVSGLGVLAFFPYAAGVVALSGALLPPAVAGSSAYISVWLLIAVYGAALRRRYPALGGGLLAGAGILAVSIAARIVDEPLCGAWPLGTHFLWHILNATMLGWMIEVYRRHMLAEGRGGR